MEKTAYELAGDIEYLKRLQDLLGDDEAEDEAVRDTLEAVTMDFIDKADDYGKVHRNLVVKADAIEAEAKAIYAEYERLMKRAKAIRSNDRRLVETLGNCMVIAGVPKIKTNLFTFFMKSTQSVVIDTDEMSRIPESLRRSEPDKTKIKKYIEALGDPSECGFAHVETKQSLTIR